MSAVPPSQTLFRCVHSLLRCVPTHYVSMLHYFTQPLTDGPQPVQEDNWPLLTVSKGFFETLAAKGKALEASKATGRRQRPGLGP